MRWRWEWQWYGNSARTFWCSQPQVCLSWLGFTKKTWIFWKACGIPLVTPNHTLRTLWGHTLWCLIYADFFLKTIYFKRLNERGREEGRQREGDQLIFYLLFDFPNAPRPQENKARPNQSQEPRTLSKLQLYYLGARGLKTCASICMSPREHISKKLDRMQVYLWLQPAPRYGLQVLNSLHANHVTLSKLLCLSVFISFPAKQG